MAGKVGLDPDDPLWQDLAEILQAKGLRADTVACPQCGEDATVKYVHKRYSDLGMEKARKEWHCFHCGRRDQSLTYWRRTGETAPRRWRVLATQANMAELLLELRRNPFWQQILGGGLNILFASRVRNGRAYVSINEALEFIGNVLRDHVYLPDDSENWPSWARGEDDQ